MLVFLELGGHHKLQILKLKLNPPFKGLLTHTHAVLTKVDHNATLVPSSPSSHSDEDSLVVFGKDVL